MESQINQSLPSLKELVKDNHVHLESYRQGNFYFHLYYKFGRDAEDGDVIYLFTVPIEDIGTATIQSRDKALTYMRWIRAALEDGTLIKL